MSEKVTDLNKWAQQKNNDKSYEFYTFLTEDIMNGGFLPTAIGIDKAEFFVKGMVRLSKELPLEKHVFLNTIEISCWLVDQGWRTEKYKQVAENAYARLKFICEHYPESNTDKKILAKATEELSDLCKV